MRPGTSAIARLLTLVGVLMVVLAASSGSLRRSARRQEAGRHRLQHVLVRVGTEAITRGDVQRRIDTLPEQFRANFGTPRVASSCWSAWSRSGCGWRWRSRTGVANRPQIRQQLEQQRRDFLVRTYVTEVMAENPAPAIPKPWPTTRSIRPTTACRRR